MSSSEIAIRVTNLSKCYEIYEKPGDRLKQFTIPKLLKLFCLKPRRFYQEFWALRQISFEVKKGETVAIIGRNGSGKSTLLQIICGTLAPTSGEIKTWGRIAALLELGSGFNPEFTGRENVYLNASVLGLTTEETDERFEKIAGFADIGIFIDQPTKTYSSGMLVRLAFAVIAHVNADILIIDEALAVGDVIFTQKCFRFIKEFKKNGAILFVSHDSGAVANISNRALWLDRGISKSAGITAKVLDEYHQATLLALDGLDSAGNQGEGILLRPEAKRVSSKFKNQLNPKAVIGGTGAVCIEAAGIYHAKSNQPLQILCSSEQIVILMAISSLEEVNQILFGFTIKDRLGQKIVEENSFNDSKSNPIFLHNRKKMVIKFTYLIPALASGKYSVDLAVAKGTQASHIPLCWIYDALQFESHPERDVLGLFSQEPPKFNVESFE